jgi:regulation of enolase protein 1 (concanavalin A-like superfamily)/ribosomal protein S18 acetylase RimI-like enzyme
MDTPPAVIRRLTPGDAAALVNFYNRLIPASKRTFRPLDAQTTLPVCEAIARDNGPAAETKLDLVAVDGPRVVGWSFVWDLNGTEPVFGLAVADDYHGRGLGSALMDAVLAAARQRGLDTIYLTVVRDNDKARGLYERRGFVTYGAFTGQDGLPYFRMVAGAPGRGRVPLRWYNAPPAWKDQAGAIEVTTGAGTDFWRQTHYGFIRDTGHFYHRTVEGDFALDVKVTGAYRDLYDQAGVMLRLDERRWMKCGIEYVNGVQNVSAVVTNDFSDWSVAPAAHNPPAIWLRVSRRRETVEVHY